MSEPGDGTSTHLQLNGNNEIASIKRHHFLHAHRLFASWT